MYKYLNWKKYVLGIKRLLEKCAYKIEISGRNNYWRIWVIDALQHLSRCELNREQINSINNFWGGINSIYHEFYFSATGRFDEKYIPDGLYYTNIDPYYNNWQEAKYVDNKTYYRMLFYDVRQPKTLAIRCGGVWTDAQEEIITLNEVTDKICSAKGCFIKKATESEGGAGVSFVDGTDVDKISVLLTKDNADLVIQYPLVQCSELNKLNESSVNTIRILSLMRNNAIKVYSTILRMGINGAKVDNASSGGITCGINDDGRLKAVAYSAKGTRYDKHPTSGVAFDSIVVPAYDKAIQLVKRLHPRFGHFKLVSWDIAIDEENEPVLIEANLHYGELDFHQLNNGPLFGADTKEIMDEVFKKH